MEDLRADRLFGPMFPLSFLFTDRIVATPGARTEYVSLSPDPDPLPFNLEATVQRPPLSLARGG